MSQQPEALRLADELEMWTLGEPAAAELRRLHEENEALHEANEAFGKRQEWWNERMFELEQQRDELLTALKKLEYSSDGYIKRYPEEAEVNAVIAKAEGKQ